MSDDGTEDFRAGMRANRLTVHPGGKPDPESAGTPASEGGVWFDDGDWEEAKIPHRPWIAPGYLLRGAVAVLGGVGSGGKSSLLVAWACSLALNMRYGRFVPVHACRVLTFNVEDDADEQKRRFSAALRQFDAAPRNLMRRVMRSGTDDDGSLVMVDPNSREMVTTPAFAQLERQIRLFRPDVVMLDPLAELHAGADENDNGTLRRVMSLLRSLARKYQCAILVAHHVKKGGGGAGEMDMLRGASSIVGSARVVMTVTPMSEDEAREHHIGPEMRMSFFRLDGAKSNYAKRGIVEWHEMRGYDLDSAEEVGACVPWQAPAEPAEPPGPSPETLALIEAGIDRGSDRGPWSPRLDPASARSVSVLMAQHGVADRRDQKAILRDLLLRRRIATWEYRDHNRIKRAGLRGATGLPEVKWLHEVHGEEAGPMHAPVQD